MVGDSGLISKTWELQIGEMGAVTNCRGLLCLSCGEEPGGRLLATPWTAATRLLRSWDFPGKSTGVGCPSWNSPFGCRNSGV